MLSQISLGVWPKVSGKSVIFSSLKIGGERGFSRILGKLGLNIERGGGGKAIFSELKIADFPKTSDHTL